MLENINKSDGREIPQLLIVDESVRGKYVEALRKNGIKTIYIGNGDGCEEGMSDKDIMELGILIGSVPIATCNPRHFQPYRKYGIVVGLKQCDSIYESLRKTEKAGIRIRKKFVN